MSQLILTNHSLAISKVRIDSNKTWQVLSGRLSLRRNRRRASSDVVALSPGYSFCCQICLRKGNVHVVLCSFEANIIVNCCLLPH